MMRFPAEIEDVVDCLAKRQGKDPFLASKNLPTCEYVKWNPLLLVTPFDTNLILKLLPVEITGRGRNPTPENVKMGSVLSVSKT
jgi:hypothetical protein